VDRCQSLRASDASLVVSPLSPISMFPIRATCFMSPVLRASRLQSMSWHLRIARAL
jgi:hypothetical protein